MNIQPQEIEMVIKNFEKKEAIIEAYISIIVKSGIQKSPIAEIARVTGIATGSVYTYFKSKNELINEAYLYVRNKEFEYVLSDDMWQKSTKEQFRQLFGGLITFFYNNPVYFEFSDRFAEGPEITVESREEIEKFTQFTKFIDNAKKDLNIKDKSTTKLLFFLFGFVSSSSRYLFKENITLTDAILDDLLELAWNGIGLKIL